MRGKRGTYNVRQSPDTERVLSRIRSGDLRCGREAARELAAEAQDAYGDAFEGSAADVLMRQAAAKGRVLFPDYIEGLWS